MREWDHGLVSLALHCIALTFLASGCSTHPDHEPDLTAILGHLSSEDGPPESGVQEHDFGTILASDQTLHHDFIIKNPSDRPIRLLRGMALTPCCSSIGPLPEPVPPHGQSKIPVTLKAGHRSEAKAARFLVEVDDPKEPVRVFALRARNVSAFEVGQSGGSSTTLPLGQAGKQVLRVTTRRKGTEGRNPPERVTVASPLVAVFDGYISTKIRDNDLVESTRLAVVTIPAGQPPGLHRDEIRFGWPDGSVES